MKSFDAIQFYKYKYFLEFPIMINIYYILTIQSIIYWYLTLFELKIDFPNFL